jgi:flagellar motility protein MotE (MotC chaperone)
MKLSMKDIILILLIAVLSFPVTYLLALYLTGNIVIQYKKPGQEGDAGGLKTLSPSLLRDSLSQANMKSFQALIRERDELRNEKEHLKDQLERVATAQEDLLKERETIAGERRNLEKLIAENQVLKEKKIKQLARVYGAMRPAEAARILESLDDNLVIKIVNGISDDRQRGKLLSALSSEKAARISKQMGR